MSRSRARQNAAGMTKLSLFAVTVDCGPGGNFSTTVETTSEVIAKKTARSRAQQMCADFGFEFGPPKGGSRFVSCRKVAP